MYDYMMLDMDNIARIGLIYMDGDKLEDILLDKHGHTDYHFENFNAVKKSLLKLERIDPGMDLTAVLWQLRPDNSELAVPVAAGNALPVEGWQRTKVNAEMRETFEKGINKVKKRSDTCTSHYYAVKNSDAEIVGVLELLHGYRVKGDI